MPCSSCGHTSAPAPTREFVYTAPDGKQEIFESETEAKIQVSVKGGGSYKVRAKK